MGVLGGDVEAGTIQYRLAAYLDDEAPASGGMLLEPDEPQVPIRTVRRKSLVKVAHDYAEKSKVAIRHVRRDGMDGLKKAEKDGVIGQDQNYPVWRAGANAATALHTDAALDLGGLAVPKGDYTVYSYQDKGIGS